MARPPIPAPPAGSPHAHLPFRISLLSVSFELQLSLVESQVQEELRRHRRHQCHQCVGVAVHAEIRLLVRLTSFFGDRFVFPVWSVIWFGVLVFMISGLHNFVSSRPCMIYQFLNLFPPFQYAYTLFPASLFYIGLSTLVSSTPTMFEPTVYV